MSARVWWRAAAAIGCALGVATGAVAQQPAPYPGTPPVMPAAPVVTYPVVQTPPSIAPVPASTTAPWAPTVPSVAASPAGSGTQGANSAPGGPTPSNTVPSGAADDAPKFDTVWNNGLFNQTKGKDFVYHIGGSVHYDAAWYTGSDALQYFPGGVGRFQDGFNIRRGRLRAEGSMYKDYDFLFELEFFNGFYPAGLTVPPGFATVVNNLGPTDAWVTVKNVPVLGNVRIGSQKEWFSLEHLNSYRYLEFMERSYLFDQSLTAFNNGFSPGISAFRTWADDRFFTGIGVYKNTTSDVGGFGLGDGQYAVTGRVTWLPVYCPDQQYFLHVGGAMSHRDPVDGQYRLRVRDTVRNAPLPLLNLIADTGVLNTDSVTMYNVESAAVYGPVTFQGEYQTIVLSDVRQTAAGPSLGTIPFQAFYVEGMVFLTGESRTWNPKTATFNRVIPKRNFGFEDGRWCGGWGAWELAARYTYLDATVRGITGGRLNNVTLGLNWYMTPNTKMQFNYDYAYRDESANPLVKGAIHAFGTRLAFDF
ncbi:MAG: porin [Gemmataceae bacterium]